MPLHIHGKLAAPVILFVLVPSCAMAWAVYCPTVAGCVNPPWLCRNAFDCGAPKEHVCGNYLTFVQLRARYGTFSG